MQLNIFVLGRSVLHGQAQFSCQNMRVPLHSTFMPPRWPRKPDRKDPDFRRLDDRMTFATHVALFAATNSGLWFFRVLGAKTSELGIPGGLAATPWITGLWALVLLGHFVYIVAIADYSETISPPTSQPGSGFTPTKKP